MNILFEFITFRHRNATRGNHRTPVSRTITSAVVALLCLSIGVTAHAASSTLTGNGYRVISSTPFNGTSAATATAQMIRLSPSIASCRFNMMFISAARPNAASMRAAIAQAINARARVNITYSTATDDVCLLDAVTPASAATTSSGVATAGEGDNNNGRAEGFNNKYATSFKSAFRDFGQGKFDEAVDPISGVLVLTHAELVIPGPAGLDIKVFRRYQSPDPETTATSLGNSLNPQYNGFGWTIMANVGGLQGAAGCESSFLTGDPQTPYYAMRLANLPVWVDGNGKSSVMLYDGSAWTSSDGVRIPCGGPGVGVDNVQPYAITPDGTKITISVPTDPMYGLPTRIEDRFGNWIQIEYVSEFLILRLLDGVSGLAGSGRAPIRKITSSDGRVVDFEYSTSDPSVPVGALPSVFDFYLKKIKYSGYEINYEYTSKQVFVTSILTGGVVPKYFLTKATYADALQFAYTYYLDAVPTTWPQTCSPVAGAGALSSLTHPNGGATNYTWIPSRRTGAGFACGILPGAGFVLPAHTMLRTKTTSDGGAWRYSYSDTPPSLVQHPIDDFIGSPAFPTFIEWGKVTGPYSTIVSQHRDRFGISVLPSESGNFLQSVPIGDLGRMVQQDTYTPGPSPTLLHTESVSYVGVGPISAPGIQHSDSNLGMTATQFANAGWLQAMKTATHSIKRGGKSYATAYEYSSDCFAATKTTENGDRTRTTEKTYAPRATQYCLNTRDKVLEGTVLRAQSDRTITPDGKSIQSEIRYGPTLSNGLSQQFSYGVTGDVSTVTDARGYKSYFDSYRRGTPQAESHPVSTFDGATDPQRIALTRVVDDLGRITSETDGEGRTTRFTYNGVHKPTSITLPRVASTPIAPFVYGYSSDSITRGGRTEVVGYDGFGRVTSYSNGITTTAYRYDAAGRRNFVSYPGSTLGQGVEFDALNRPTKLTEPSPANAAVAAETIITYNDNLSTVTIKNPRNFITVLTTEAFGDPAQGWLKSRSSPEIGLMTFDRNVFGQIERISHPGTSTVRDFAYDANKGYFLSQETHPELGTVFYDRDDNGNAVGKRVGSNTAPTTVYAYDGQNRLSTTTPPPNGTQVTPVVSNAWYKTGQIKGTTAGNVTRNYTYDENDNLTAEQVSIDGAIRTLAYEYDTLDNLTRLTYPSGKFVEFNPDVLGRPQQVGSPSSVNVASAVTYWPSGMLKKVTFANGVVQDFTEQSRPLVSALSIANSTMPLMNLGFGYDAVGNLTSTTDGLSLGYARNATYDTFDRILSSGNESFTYEGIGDIKTKAGATYAYGPSNRLLSSISGTIDNRAYQYDSYGNATTDRANRTYSYDALSSLRRATIGSNTPSTYDYDGHQHLAKKVANDGTTHYLYGKGGRLFGEYVPATGKRKEYFYLGSKLVGQTAN